jgi:hypothetical protein
MQIPDSPLFCLSPPSLRLGGEINSALPTRPTPGLLIRRAQRHKKIGPLQGFVPAAVLPLIDPCR